MQVNRVISRNPKQEKQNENINKNKSFKGLDGFCLGTANLIENGGLAVSFTLQDMLGTNFPRPIMGMFRNSKENQGKKNTSFALKETVREFLTGPSMFIIPSVMLFAAKKMFGEACSIPANFIKSFGNIHAGNAANYSKTAPKTSFYTDTFAEILKNAKGEAKLSAETKTQAEAFAQNLAEGIASVKDESIFTRISHWYQSLKTGKKFGLEKTITDLSSKFEQISKSHAADAAYTDFTAAKLTDGAQGSFKSIVSHMISYADDAVTKASKQAPDKIKEFIKNTADKKVIGRFALNAAMYTAVMAFLTVIPKLYNAAEGKSNAGLKGLMREETFNDKELNARTAKTQKNDKKAKPGLNPSFGSLSSAAADKITKGGFSKIASALEFSGCSVSYPELFGVMTFGILYQRLKQAKDKYDYEEIAKRDGVTCAVMCFGLKWLEKAFSKMNEVKSGLVLASKDKNFKDKNILSRAFDYFRPVKGVNVLSSDQIRAKYSDIGSYKNGILGFCSFIAEQGGNLGKVFSLDDTAKSIVNGLLQKEGKNIASADNKTIMQALEKAKKSDAVKQLTDLFKNNDNVWVKKARTLNARFTTLSVLVLVPAFLGFMLPWINERSTKKRIKEEQAALEGMKKQHNSTNFDYLMKETRKTKVFSNM